MDEKVCPRCKTTSYTNPNLKLLVNTCGHRLCQTCVDVLFTRPSSACPECRTPLRRADFRVQQFEDSLVEREVDIRRRIIKVYNKREKDFEQESDPLMAYNNYLEEVESIIWNLANNINVEDTKKKVERFKKDNETAIRKNNSKLLQEEAVLLSKLELEKKDADQRQREAMAMEQDAVSKRRKEKDALINDLMYANVPAEEIVARHRHQKEKEMELEEEKKSFFFDKFKKPGDKSSQYVKAPVKTGPLYSYQPIQRVTLGPTPPAEDSLVKDRYLQYVRAATERDRASGYSETMACQRAIEEAFDCLYM